MTGPGDGATPTRIGGYVLEELLGRGGQGSVWRARDEQLGRTVALKVLTELSTDGLARFEREARIASRLEHPGICTIYGTGRDGDTPWIAMQHVVGESLATQIKTLKRARDEAPSGTVPALQAPAVPLQAAVGSSSQSDHHLQIERLLRFFADAARCLHAAHHAGLVHRDVKPGNLMVAADGQPVLLDFGLARDATAQAAGLTAASALVGTPEYMAPEQLRVSLGSHDEDARQPGPRTDLWGLGVSLFEALTLQLPFRATTWSELVRQIVEQPPPDPCRRRRGVPRELRAVLETALEKNPERRYRSAAEFADDLDRVRRGEAIAARPIPPIRRLWLWTRRHPALAVTALAAVTLSALLLWSGGRAAEQRAQQAREVAARALLLYESADWEGCLALIDEARGLGHPEPAELELLGVATLTASGDVADARERLDALPWLADPMLHALAQLLRGELTLALPGTTDPGAEEIQTALDSGALPPSEEAYARALIEPELDLALAATAEALRLNPRHRRARQARCLLLQASNPEEARDLALALLEQRPDDALALTMLGIAVQRTAGSAAAQETMDTAWRRARGTPSWSEADEEQASALQHDLQEFLQDFTIFQQLEPTMVEALDAAREGKDLAAPVEEFGRLLPWLLEDVARDADNLRRRLPRRSPRALSDAWAEFQLGLVTVLRDAAPIAERQLDRLLSRRSDGAVLLLRGLLRLRDDRWAAAAEDFEAAWSAPSRFEVAGMASILALHARERAWTRSPEDSTDRARSLRGMQRALDRLLSDLNRRSAQTRQDDRAQFAAHLGPLLDQAIEIAVEIGDLHRADLLADTWRHRAPVDHRAWLRHAEVCREQGHLFRARDLAEIALQLTPGDARARGLLNELERALPSDR